MGPQSSRQRHLRNRLFVPALVVLAIVTTTTIGIALNSAIRANVGPLGLLVLLLIFLVAIVTALASTEIIPWHELSWRHLRQPRILATFGSVILVSFGAVFSYIPLLSEQGGLDAAVGQMRAALGDIGADARAARTAAEGVQNDLAPFVPRSGGTLVEQRINGVWGQRGCANTYRFTLDQPGRDGRPLTVDSIMSAPGLRDYNAVFAFKAANDQLSRDGHVRSILSVEEVSGNNIGAAVEFVLTRVGSQESLIWDSKVAAQNSVELVRCP